MRETSKKARDDYFKRDIWSKEFPVNHCGESIPILKSLGFKISRKGWVKSSMDEKICLTCEHCNNIKENKPFLYCLLNLYDEDRQEKDGYKFYGNTIMGDDFVPTPECPQYMEWLLKQNEPA